MIEVLKLKFSISLLLSRKGEKVEIIWVQQSKSMTHKLRSSHFLFVLQFQFVCFRSWHIRGMRNEFPGHATLIHCVYNIYIYFSLIKNEMKHFLGGEKTLSANENEKFYSKKWNNAFFQQNKKVHINHLLYALMLWMCLVFILFGGLSIQRATKFLNV